MATNETPSAKTQPPLRWYQFSIGGLLLLTLFIAILLSILGVGRALVRYDAKICTRWNFPIPHLLPSETEGYFDRAIWDSDVEYAMSDSMMESVAQKLRKKGIETIDGERVVGPTLRRHVLLEQYKTIYVDIIASSYDLSVSKSIACEFCDTWSNMTETLSPVVKQRYEEKARSEFSPYYLQKFESQWPELVNSFTERRRLVTLRHAILVINVLGDHRDPAFVTAVYPYWTTCEVVACAWFGIGAITFGVNRWRRYSNSKSSARKRDERVPDFVICAELKPLVIQ
jgi:hypothetical protein